MLLQFYLLFLQALAPASEGHGKVLRYDNFIYEDNIRTVQFLKRVPFTLFL